MVKSHDKCIKLPTNCFPRFYIYIYEKEFLGKSME